VVFRFSRLKETVMNVVMRAAAGVALVVALAPVSGPAAEEPAKANAALVYWQAFAMIPQLDKGQLKIVGDHSKVKLDKDVDKLLASCETSLRLMHRATTRAHCDWGVSVLEDGIYTLMPHMDRGFRLARIALLRARKRLESSDPRGGMEDALAAMTLGRHLGTDKIALSLLVQLAVERQAIDLLARHLPALGAKDRAALRKRLDGLPVGATL